MSKKDSRPDVNKLLALALLELDSRTAPNATERPTPVIKAVVEALTPPETEPGEGG